MNFNMHQSGNKAEYFLDSFITCKSLKLVNNIFNQFNHQYSTIFLLILYYNWAENVSKYENSWHV